MLIVRTSAIENDEGLEYFQPCDIVKLSVAQGTFTQEADSARTADENQDDQGDARHPTTLNAYEESGNYLDAPHTHQSTSPSPPAFTHAAEDAADRHRQDRPLRAAAAAPAPASRCRRARRGPSCRGGGDEAERCVADRVGMVLSFTTPRRSTDLAAVRTSRRRLLRTPRRCCARPRTVPHSVPGEHRDHLNRDPPRLQHAHATPARRRRRT